jgi:hypothetical protein
VLVLLFFPAALAVICFGLAPWELLAAATVPVPALVLTTAGVVVAPLPDLELWLFGILN